MRICILGAGGCFGQGTAQHLMDAGHEVIGIGRSPRKSAAFVTAPDLPYAHYHIVHDLEYVMAALDHFQPEVIVNYAAQGEGAASFKDDNWRFYDTNATGLVRLVSGLRHRNYLSRFVHIGTSELYGSVTAPAKETDAIQPTSPYAASKAAFDLHLMAIAKVQEFPMNIIRPSNCYCPGQQLHRIIPKAILYGLTGRKLPLHGGGRAEKSYLHAKDLSRAIEVVIDKAPLGEVYNVGPLAPTSIKRVVELCATAVGIPFEELCEMAPDREGQDSRYWLDITKIARLGWTQTIGWERGLATVVDWAGEHLEELSGLDTEFRMRS